MSRRVPLSGRAYGLVARLATPALILSSRRSRRGGLQAAAERFGHGGPGDGVPRLWLHGASVGEAAAARSLFDAVIEKEPELEAVGTAHTLTGRTTLEGWLAGRAPARLAPWDTPPAVRRFLHEWTPAAYVFVDSELWPTRILRLTDAGACIVGVNARVSERSAERWARFAPGLVRAMLSRIDLLCPQDDASAERFLRLGIDPTHLGPCEELKSALPPSAPLADEDVLRAALPRQRTVLAASTHPGEEALALAAWQVARRRVPDLRLMIAPRHPDRAGEIADLVRGQDLFPILRSTGEVAGLSSPNAVYVADTLGELRRFYAMASLAFVGGSTGTLGGHTPFEPVAEGCVIAHGPDTANAADAYRSLDDAGAAMRVETAEDLAEAFALAARPERLDEMAERASHALTPAPSVVPSLVAERVVRAIAAREGSKGET